MINDIGTLIIDSLSQQKVVILAISDSVLSQYYTNNNATTAHFNIIAVRRYCCKAIISRILGVVADAVQLQYGSHGKPSVLVANAPTTPMTTCATTLTASQTAPYSTIAINDNITSPPTAPLHFSASHTRGWYGIALAQSHQVGFDIEYFAPHKHYRSIAEWLNISNHTAPTPLQLLKTWVRCESIIKCYGGTIAHPPPVKKLHRTQSLPTNGLLRLQAPRSTGTPICSPHRLYDIAFPLPHSQFYGALTTRGYCSCTVQTHVVKERELTALLSIDKQIASTT